MVYEYIGLRDAWLENNVPQPLSAGGHRCPLEATTGFEPVNGGFADPCLTTWLRRHDADFSILNKGCQSRFGVHISFHYNCDHDIKILSTDHTTKDQLMDIYLGV